MQQQKSTFLDFSRRTDALALKLGVDVGELPSVLEFSRASLFAYRKGKARITDKAWLRLEAAERSSGLSPPGSDYKIKDHESARIHERPHSDAPLSEDTIIAALEELEEIRDRVGRLGRVLAEEHSRHFPSSSSREILKNWTQPKSKK